MGHTRTIRKFDILTFCIVRYRIQKRNRNQKKKEGTATMGPRFDETQRCRKFYDRDIPMLIEAIQENTAELKRANDLKEAELKKEGADNGND